MAKNLIFCFDGTENDPNDAKPERKWFGLFGQKDNSISNIFKLHLYFGGDLQNNPHSSEQQSFYYPGVGTYGSWLRQKFNAALAPEKMDVRLILNRAGADLQRHYQKGDRIYLFGFSRGAALARRFAAILHQYCDLISANDAVVDLLGVFDTVASIGAPNLDDDHKPRTHVVFENMTVSPHVKQALQLLSVDEDRVPFQPTLMNRDDRVTEVWFPGAHSDVGGGRLHHGLADVALKYMVDDMHHRHEELTILGPLEVALDKVVVAKGSYKLKVHYIEIRPNHLGKLHIKKGIWSWLKSIRHDREVRVNVDDKKSDHLPVVHHRLVDRAKQDGDYRPAAMHQVTHLLLDEEGNTTEYPGLGDHLLP